MNTIQPSIQQNAMQRKESSVTMVISGRNPLFRRGLVDYLREIVPHRLLAEIDDAALLKDALLRHQPTLAVVELSAEHSHAAETVRFLAAKPASTASIVLAPYTDGLLLINAHFAGVGGCVVQDHAAVELPEAVSAVLNGDTYLSPMLSKLLAAGRTVLLNEREPALSTLTRAEQRILELISSSKSTTEIADHLNISPRTVDHHRLRICRKLNLSGRYSLLRYALDNKRFLSAMELLLFSVFLPT